jgi:hypothetical protein
MQERRKINLKILVCSMRLEEVGDKLTVADPGDHLRYKSLKLSHLRKLQLDSSHPEDQ